MFSRPRSTSGGASARCAKCVGLTDFGQTDLWPILVSVLMFRRGHVPDDVCYALMLATMTGLQKRDGGVSGIATGTSFRRLVAKVLARQFSDAVEATCAPFQFALCTRAGTDCVGHVVRVAAEMNQRLTVLSPYHIYRSAMLSKVAGVPSLQGLLLIVRKHTFDRVRTFGQTKRASNTRLVWASTTRWRKCSSIWSLANDSLPTWMTCTS